MAGPDPEHDAGVVVGHELGGALEGGDVADDAVVPGREPQDVEALEYLDDSLDGGVQADVRVVQDDGAVRGLRGAFSRVLSRRSRLFRSSKTWA